MSDEADRVRAFTEFRQRMNQRILAEPNQVVRRFFALDTQTYQAGALDVKTKELCGLVASMVLRCDDCISYHVAQCREAGVSRDRITRASEQLVGRSVDGWTSGFRTELALDGREALVAFGLNGSELPVKHGYPVRLVVPGLYGYVSATKWLTEIELTNWDFDAYWIQRTWSKEGPVKTQSRIDTVKDGDSLSAGTVRIGGVAWAPHRGISKVEVSTDGGASWNEARLAAQLDEDTWRQYVYDWDARPGEYTLQVRATDGEGRTQTEEEAPPHPSGATGYHTIDVSVA